jgi:hypothetical protein
MSRYTFYDDNAYFTEELEFDYDPREYSNTILYTPPVPPAALLQSNEKKKADAKKYGHQNRSKPQRQKKELEVEYRIPNKARKYNASNSSRPSTDYLSSMEQVAAYNSYARRPSADHLIPLEQFPTYNSSSERRPSADHLIPLKKYAAYNNSTRRPSADHLLPLEKYATYNSASTGLAQPNSLYSKTYDEHESGRSFSLGSRGQLIEQRYSTRVGAPRYCCGFFSKRKSCLICNAVFLVFLIILGTVGFFLFPRTPTITFNNPANINGLQTAPNPLAACLKASPTGPFIISLRMGINLNLESQNMLSTSFDDLLVTAQMLDPEDSGKLIQGKIGRGEMGRFQLRSMSTSTLQAPFSLDFSFDKPMESISDDARIFALMRSCHPQLFPGLPPSKASGRIGLRLEAIIKNKFIDWTGIQTRVTVFSMLPSNS